MNTVNNSYSDERPSLDHMKKCLEARMEQSPARDALVTSLLRLLRAGSLFLI